MGDEKIGDERRAGNEDREEERKEGRKEGGNCVGDDTPDELGSWWRYNVPPLQPLTSNPPPTLLSLL